MSHYFNYWKAWKCIYHVALFIRLNIIILNYDYKLLFYLKMRNWERIKKNEKKKRKYLKHKTKLISLLGTHVLHHYHHPLIFSSEHRDRHTETETKTNLRSLGIPLFLYNNHHIWLFFCCLIYNVGIYLIFFSFSLHDPKLFRSVSLWNSTFLDWKLSLSLIHKV
jgi:hypothetical protein